MQAEPTQYHWFKCPRTTGPKREPLEALRSRGLGEACSKPPHALGCFSLSHHPRETLAEQGGLGGQQGVEGPLSNQNRKGTAAKQDQPCRARSRASGSGERASTPVLSCATLVRFLRWPRARAPRPQPPSFWGSSKVLSAQPPFPSYSTCLGSKQNQGPPGSGRQVMNLDLDPWP